MVDPSNGFARHQSWCEVEGGARRWEGDAEAPHLAEVLCGSANSLDLLRPQCSLLAQSLVPPVCNGMGAFAETLIVAQRK